jgi:hypothetical protein
MERRKKKPITGREGSAIDLELAASWTKNYRDKHPGEAISQFFGKEILEKILSQEHCLGIRFYYALDREGKKHLIIAGAMSDGTDQIHAKAKAPAEAAPGGAPRLMAATATPIYTVGEMSSPCPGSPGCPTNVLTGETS